MNKFGRAIGNTVGGITRGGIGTPLVAAIDTLRAGGHVFHNFGSIVNKTASNIKEIFLSPYAPGPMKRYKRVGAAFSSPFIATGALIEGAVRSVLEPSRNAMLNIRDITGNGFQNLGASIKTLFDTTRPVSDFSFQHLQFRDVQQTHRIEKALRWNR